MQLIWLLSIVSLGTVSTGLASMAAPYSIFIQAEKAEFKVGEPISINIRLTNISDHAADSSSSWGKGIDYSYRYDVYDDSGTLRKKHLPSDEPNSVLSDQMQKLEPGKSQDENVDLGRACDMSEPGVYTIRVLRDISSDPKDGVVKSNEITVKVVPDATKK